MGLIVASRGSARSSARDDTCRASMLAVWISVPWVVIGDQFDEKRGLGGPCPRVHPQPPFLAVIRQTLDALADTQFVQEGRNLFLDHPALAHGVHECLRIALKVPDSLCG